MDVRAGSSVFAGTINQRGSLEVQVTKNPEDTTLARIIALVDVLVQATEAGVWALHCHVLNHVESDDGMHGMVTAIIVK